MTSNPAIAVQEFGQSIWLDYIHRLELQDGTLQQRIDEQGIVGITSNPSIFQKAIGDSDTYDDAMRNMLELEPAEVYERLAIADIQMAADMFRPVYERTKGRDGYVSLEVSPLLADNTEDTIAEAKRLHAAVDRPNLMVKIPATEAGIPAIEACIAAGINVNVTLIFSVDNYEHVAAAYINGLEKRAEAGEDITHVASVASFFLSRIDVAVDRILQNNIRVAQVHGDTTRIAANRKLLGQAAIANAKLAYQAFQRIFSTGRFKRLAEQGAQVQRPLWASTSTKNPAYSDTRYIDLLIGADTVNTVPPKTLAAFIDHGTAAETLTHDLEDYLPPQDVMSKLYELGLDIGQVTQRLQVDGVDAFIDSFETLIDQVEAKIMVLKTGVMARQKMALGIYADAVSKAISDVEKKYINGRIWSKDGSIWTSYNPTIKAIEKRMGWLDVLKTIDLPRLQALQDSIKDSAFETVVLLGMGGSSLAPEVLYETFGKQDAFPALIVLDSTDPTQVQAVREAIDIGKTLFVVASKSGTTLETMSLYKYFWQQSNHNGAQFMAITDADTPLAHIATEQNFRDLFINPSDIGGRYSALSYFGMVPAALIGLDLDKLWASAARMIKASHENIPGTYHPGISMGAMIGAIAKEGRNKVEIYATQSMRAFGAWAEQLIAESTGKDGKGILPVVGSECGTPNEYATDRLFIYIRVDDDPDVDEMDERIRSLREAGHPRLTFRLPDVYSIAGEFFRWAYGTAIAAYVLELNPFDEPNVAEAKAATHRKLAHYEENGTLPQLSPIISGEHIQLYSNEHTLAPLRELCRSHGYDPNSRTEMLAAQIAGTHAGDYFALLCYFSLDEKSREMLRNLQERMRRVTTRAVTVGVGPRYLHSTGQLHKGGTNKGIFFIFTLERETDVDIPDTPYSFGTLINAQAAGEMDTLQAHERRVIHLHIDDDVINGLQKLMDAIGFVEERKFKTTV